MKTKSLVAGIIIAAACTMPFAASALSIDELQQQIKDLLAKVASLQAQVRVQSDASSSAIALPVASPNARICTILNRNLSRGQSGEDVKGLQEFLSTQGVFSASATGFFGPATAQAVAKWQSQNGVSALGSFGPLSRERIKIWCNNSGNALLQVSPNKGAAPLTITVTSKTGDASDYRPSIADGRDTMIDFGDGTERQWVHCATTQNEIYPQRCVTPVSFSHTYSTNGTYVVSLVKSGGFCAGGCKDETLASEKVVVGDTSTNQGVLGADPTSGAAPLAVTFSYQPAEENGTYWIEFGDGQGQIMNIHPIQCFRAPCISPMGATHTYSSAGTYQAYVTAYIACAHQNPQCKIATIPLAKTTITVTGTSVSPESDLSCKAWYDGCNSCGRTSPGGPAFCTLKYCTPEATTKPYCTAYFDDSSTSNKSPVVSSFSGPTSLAVNEIGTWKVTATDPENGTLSYSILWGDEWTAYDASLRSIAPSESIQQNTTFTHSYANAGNYNVAVTVTDASGKTARTTGSVQVTQTACTAQYAPVCARPNGCANTCPAGAFCTLQCQLYAPQTYSNRCQANNSNATFMHEGVCTGNEGYLQ